MTTQSLQCIARDIAREHRLAQEAAASALDHAKACGELLAEAKNRVGHGGWGAWLGEHFPASARTARLYMRISERWEEIQKRQRVANLPIREVARLLAKKSESPAVGGNGDERPFLTEISVERRRDMFERWWDLFASYVLLLDADGWEAKAIADNAGMPPEEVEAVLSPRVPELRFGIDGNECAGLRGAFRGAVEASISRHLHWRYQTALWWVERGWYPDRVRPILEAGCRRLPERDNRLEVQLCDWAKGCGMKDDAAGAMFWVIADATFEALMIQKPRRKLGDWFWFRLWEQQEVLGEVGS